MSALTTGQFATAHEKLGRNRPTSGLREDHLVRQFFQEVVGERGTVESWTAFSVCVECSICCVVVGFGVSMYILFEFLCRSIRDDSMPSSSIRYKRRITHACACTHKLTRVEFTEKHHFFVALQVDTGNSILSDLTKRELSKKVGHFGFNIRYRTREGETILYTRAPTKYSCDLTCIKCDFLCLCV